MKKLIIFDMDGVIIDSVHLFVSETVKNHPGMTEALVKEIHKGNSFEEIEKVRHLYPQREETDEGKELRWQLYSEKKLSASIFFGIKDLLNDLHSRGNVLALNTSASNRNTVPILVKNGIDHLFDFIGTAEVSKNKTEKFKIIEKTLVVDNENTYFATDSLGDLKEAHKAGIKTIAVTWGIHDRNCFNDEEYDNLIAVVESIEELKSCLSSC